MPTEIQRVANAQVASRVQALQPDITPDHLRSEVCQKQDTDFDPNVYFSILQNISIKPGYVIDYYYSFGSIGGKPYLYFRKQGDAPITTYEEHSKWKAGNEFLSFLVADGTPDSFFQLSMLTALGSQFYLFGHALYNDAQILIHPASMKGITEPFEGIRFCLTPEEREAAKPKPIDPHPVVEFCGDQATVQYYTYSKFSGYHRIRESYARGYPHLRVDSSRKVIKAYDCGIRY